MIKFFGFIYFIPPNPKLSAICFVLVLDEKITKVFICFVPAKPKLNAICFVLVLKQMKTNENKLN